jgi:hypothetical protein
MPARDVHLVPLLSAGPHYHPRKGGCLLELVSALPGGAWTDHPPGIDPVFGVLARAVNDATTDAQRPALAQLISWLATLPPVPDEQAAAVVVAACLRAALPRSDPAQTAALTHAADLATDAGDCGDRWWERRARRRAAICAVRLAVGTINRPTHPAGAAAAPDQTLAALLTDALSSVRLLHGLPPVPALARPAAACRVSVPVRSTLRAPDGAESLHHHANALVEYWPRWLLDSSAAAHNPAAGSAETAGTAPDARAAEDPRTLAVATRL